MERQRITLSAQAHIVPKSDERYQAIASAIKKYGLLDLKPQVDLMYVESCLVTAGINDNDDCFTREELWGARHTPVLKACNWGHNDKDILGVVFSVQARDLDGNILDFDENQPPNIPFELWTEAAIFKLIHRDKAEEIQKRHTEGSLFVSMEAWFDDYNYGLFDAEGWLVQKIDRNSDTVYLDKSLKANGGVGRYEDQRLGRLLKNITFGGYGFVDVPANKRSLISDVKDLDKTVSHDQLLGLLERLMNQLDDNKKEENIPMTTHASNSNENITRDDVVSAVESVISRNKAEEADAAEKKALQTKASQFEEQSQTLAQEINTLKQENVVLVKEVESLKASIKSFAESMEGFIVEAAELTGSVPPEISAIDAAINQGTGDAVFNAKLQWMNQTMANLKAKADKVDSLEEELAIAAEAMREQEIRALFADIDTIDEKAVEAMVATSASLNEDEYNSWFAEREYFAEVIKAASQTSPPNDKQKMSDEEMMKKKKVKSAEQTNVFQALTDKLRSEGAEGYEQSESLGINSGASPSAPGLRVPRFKIAGSAEADPNGVLDYFEPADSVNFAGASLGDNEQSSPFRALAHEICPVDNSDDDSGEN